MNQTFQLGGGSPAGASYIHFTDDCPNGQALHESRKPLGVVESNPSPVFAWFYVCLANQPADYMSHRP